MLGRHSSTIVLRHPVRRLQVIGSSPGMACARMRVRTGPGLNRLTRTLVDWSRPHRCAPAPRARLWRRRRAPNRRSAICATPEETNTTRPASENFNSGSMRADEPPIGGDVDRHHLVPRLRLDMAERRERSENARHCRPARRAGRSAREGEPEPVDPLVVPEVERNERRRAAGPLDRVVELLEPADGARDRDDMRAGLGQR